MEINWLQIGLHLLHLLLAFLLALPIGWDREQAARSAGLRTFPLVALGSCGFVLIGLRVLGSDSQAQARIIDPQEQGKRPRYRDCCQHLEYWGGRRGSGVRSVRDRAGAGPDQFRDTPLARYPQGACTWVGGGQAR
jgi:hypothetical protein